MATATSRHAARVRAVITAGRPGRAGHSLGIALSGACAAGGVKAASRVAVMSRAASSAVTRPAPIHGGPNVQLAQTVAHALLASSAGPLSASFWLASLGAFGVFVVVFAETGLLAGFFLTYCRRLPSS